MGLTRRRVSASGFETPDCLWSALGIQSRSILQSSRESAASPPARERGPLAPAARGTGDGWTPSACPVPVVLCADTPARIAAVSSAVCQRCRVAGRWQGRGASSPRFQAQMGLSGSARKGHPLALPQPVLVCPADARLTQACLSLKLRLRGRVALELSQSLLN